MAADSDGSGASQPAATVILAPFARANSNSSRRAALTRSLASRTTRMRANRSISFSRHGCGI